MVKVKTPSGTFDYKKSTRKDKKLMTIVDGKKIHFGNIHYEQYKDKTKIWSSLDHCDEERRSNYQKRASAIRDKSGNLTYDDPHHPNYHAFYVLW